MNEDEFFKHAKDALFPKLKDSALSLTIVSDNPDPKLCMELGAAILFDKPLILLVLDAETKISANLKRVASAIIVGNPRDPATQKAMQEAITNVLANDKRAHA